MTTILDLSSRNPERYLQKRRSYEKITLNVSNKLNDNSRSRDGLLRTLLGIESGLSDIQPGDDSSLHGLSSIPEIKKSKKRAGSGMELDSPSTPSSIMQFYRRIPSVKNTAYGALVFNPCRRQAHIFPGSATLYHTYRQRSWSTVSTVPGSSCPPERTSCIWNLLLTRLVLLLETKKNMDRKAAARKGRNSMAGKRAGR